MAAIKRLLTQTRRTLISDPQPRLQFLIRRQSFSSESDPAPPPQPNINNNNFSREPIQIQAVSYAAKPKPEPPIQQQQINNNETNTEQQQQQQSWTRDEMRYMKDTTISPVSYPSRVAPLPDDKVGVEEGGNVELERERRRIDDEQWRAMRERRVMRGREDQEDLNLPFPQLIKVDSTSGEESSKKKKVKALFDLKEALRLVKAKAKDTFDETLEAHVKMTPDLRRTDLKLSGFVRFPHGFGKTYRVAVFAEGAAADEARDAGADVIGGPELVDDILSGQVKIDFDRCIATPSMMQHVKKLSKNLKQLMPDPKKRTVTNDMSRAVKESKEQGVLFKKDKTAIVHVGLGKVSFSEDALRDNIGAFVNALLLAKPAGLKKSSKYAGYVDSFHICSTMGPSFPITIQSLSMAADRYNRLQLGVQSEAA